MEMDAANWRISDATRALWRASAPLPRGCQFYNLYARGFETPFHLQYGSEAQPLADLTDIVRQPVRSCEHVDGDCTVPVCCAVAGTGLAVRD